MKKHILALALMALAASPVLAHAADKPAMAAAADVPEAVKTYVNTHPSDILPYSGKVEVGHPIDGDQIWMQIPAAPAYRWTNLNGQKVIVDKKTGHVVAVY